jgi:hypothetical protein
MGTHSNSQTSPELARDENMVKVQKCLWICENECAQTTAPPAAKAGEKVEKPEKAPPAASPATKAGEKREKPERAAQTDLKVSASASNGDPAAPRWNRDMEELWEEHRPDQMLIYLDCLVRPFELPLYPLADVEVVRRGLNMVQKHGLNGEVEGVIKARLV